MSQAAMIEAVRGALGPGAIVTDPSAIAPWLTDWRGRWHGASPVMLQPATTAEVAQVVALAAEHRVPLVPQGGNTSMVGGATPPADGSALLLSLRRLNRVRAVADDQAVVGAGVILEHLHAAAAAQRLRFPLTLGARGSCTVGGLVATNAGGTQVLRFGTMRRLVLGVEAVLADGSVHDGLAGLRKDNRGYDLNQLLIGSEGTLGVVTAATLRLVPAPIARAVAWVGVDTPEAALRLLRSLQSAAGERIEGFEIVPDEALRRVLGHIPRTRPPLKGSHPWHVLIEATTTRTDGEVAGELLERLLAPALDHGDAGDAVIAASEAQAQAFWHIRDSISAAERSAGQAVQHDISVRVDDMPRFMVEAAAEVERAFPGTQAFGYGHLGDGNIHFHVRAPIDAAPGWADGAGHSVTRFVHDLVTAAGGSISAEHGIGQMKVAELARLHPQASLRAMRAIKHALDPEGLLNPGKLLG